MKRRITHTTIDYSEYTNQPIRKKIQVEIDYHTDDDYYDVEDPVFDAKFLEENIDSGNIPLVEAKNDVASEADQTNTSPVTNSVRTARQTWNETFYLILRAIAGRSSCVKHKVAACVIRDTQIISIGYNGTPAGHPECSDLWDPTKPNFREEHRKWSVANEIHAEANALRHILWRDAVDCALICLYFPCVACAKQIIAYQIRTVYFYEIHSTEQFEQSKKILLTANVELIHLDTPNV